VKVTAPQEPLKSYIGSNGLPVALQIPALNDDSLAAMIAFGPLLALIGVAIFFGVQRRNRVFGSDLFLESP
jgi:hypothetical protein